MTQHAATPEPDRMPQARDARPPVVAMAELVEMLGLTKARVATLSDRPDFPAPWTALRCGRLWRYDEVEAWARASGRELHALTPLTPRTSRTH